MKFVIPSCNILPASLLFFVLLTFQNIFAQTDPVLQRYRNDEKGSINYRKEGTLQKNLVRTLFQNNGEIGHWPYSPSCEWPKGSGIDNTNGIAVLIASEVKLPGGAVIHPLETSYREWMDMDFLTGELWGLEPLPGYTSDAFYRPAMASDPYSWPEKWPAALGLTSDWDRHFYSYFGKTPDPAVEEAFFVVDDSKDGEWKRPPYNFFPIKSDSLRGGLGLRIETRALQGDYMTVKDVIFWNYDIINIADSNYQNSYFGLYADIGCGGFNSSPDNADYTRDINLVYTWDSKGTTGLGKQIGYTGYALLKTPLQLGLTALSVYILGDGGVGGGWPKDDESMWLKLSSARFDTQIQNKNISMVMASGPFPLKQTEKTGASSALIFGQDLKEVILNKNIAQQVFNDNFKFSDSLRFPSTIKLAITYPLKGSSVSGNTEITWSSSGTYGKTVTNIYYSNDDLNFFHIGTDSLNSGKFIWNTTGLKDGVFYKLRIMSAAINGIGFAESDYFTVNNPGNTAPQIKIINIKKNNVLSGSFNIKWIAGDADNDPFYSNFFYRPGISSNWVPVASNIKQTDTLFQWDTRKFANSKNGELMAQVISLSDTGQFVVGPIELNNERNIYSGTDYVIQRHSFGTGNVSLVKINPSEITGHDYIIQFDSLYSSHKLIYNVIDRNNGRTVISNEQEMSGDAEGPYFDGLRLLMRADTIDINSSKTGWISGKSNLSMAISRSSNKQYGLCFPYDYQLEFSGTKQIPSFDGNQPPSGPYVNFIVKNLSHNDTSTVLVNDINGNNILDVGEQFSIVEFVDLNKNGINELRERRYNWDISYSGIPGTQPVEPAAGDKFLLTTTKPFIKGDTLIISTNKLTNLENEARSRKDFFISQNYPNPFNPNTRIDFEVIKPGKVSIVIFDALGREIKTLVSKEFNAGRYSISWDGTSDSGSALSSGIYYYQIKASDFTYTKKMIMLK